MGNKTSQQFLSVASLNYSGIQDSPYEFYEYENQSEKKLYAIFRDVCRKMFKDFDSDKFKWIMGKVDKEWHSRYSPLYHRYCGIKNNEKMMTAQQFINQWDQVAKKQFSKYEQKIYGKLPEAEKQACIPKQLEECKQFDLAVYLSLLTFVYGVQDPQKAANLDAKAYRTYRDNAFHKTFLDGKLKQNKALKYFRESGIQVYFIQEMDINLLEEIEAHYKEYFVCHKIFTFGSSAILIKRDKFPYIKDFREANYQFNMEYFKRCNSNPDIDLNWNDDTVYQIAGNYLLISAHLTSKKQPNKEQVTKMKETLKKLKKYFPELKIIAGGDYNTNIEFGFTVEPEQGKLLGIQVVPDSKTESTCNKKRTLMQAQKNKAEMLSKEVKDYIITTENIRQYKIITMQGTNVMKAKTLPLLPNSEHPYDHYLVVGTLDFDPTH